MSLPTLHTTSRFSTAARPVPGFLFLFALLLGGPMLQAQTTWDGSDSNDWADTANWSAGVPDAMDDVIIPSSMPFNPTISMAALAKSVTVLSGAVLTNAAAGTLTIDGSATQGILNQGTVENFGTITIGATTNTGLYGIRNQATFNNNNGGKINTDRLANSGITIGIWNETGTFTNEAAITIGAIANTSPGTYGLSNSATFNNNNSGEIRIDRSTNNGLANGGTFNNAAKIIIGATADVGFYGLYNSATFNNNSGGEINIDRSTGIGIALWNADGTFTNVAKISIGATASIGDYGFRNEATFNNNSGGQISIDGSIRTALWNYSGTFTNAAKITIGAVASAGLHGIRNRAMFDNNSGGEISIDQTSTYGLWNQASGTFTNAAEITIGAVASVGSEGILNSAATFNNSTCTALVHIVSNSIVTNTGTFTNAGSIIENASGTSSITSNSGIVQNLNGGTFAIVTNTGLLTTSAGQLNACCFISGPTSVCADAQITLSSNCGTGGTWGSDNTAVATVNSANGVVTGMSAGTATISYTEGSNTATTVVTVNAALNAAIAIAENNVQVIPFTSLAYYNVSYTDGILCTGPDAPNPSTSATLTASGGGTYLWSNSATTAAITVSMAGTYTVVVTTAGCQSTVTKTIAVNSAPNAGTITAIPNIPAINGSKGVCFGSTITLSNNVLGGVWAAVNKVPPVVSVDPMTGVVIPLVNTFAVDTHTVIYRVTASGCYNSAITSIEVLNPPNAGTISGNANICSSPFFGNYTTQLTINGGASGGTWASSNTSVATVDASGLVTSALPFGTNSGTTTISYTVTNGTCSNTATILITVNANPSALVTSTPQNTCINTDVAISVPDAGTGANYAWSGDITNTNSNTIISNSSTPGSKVYSVTVTAANGCVNAGFGSHFVNQPINTTITATPNPVCLGVTLSLSIPQAASTTVSWSGPGINSTTGFSTTASPTTAGLKTYTVTATTDAYLGNCVYTGMVDVMVETTQPTCSITGPSLVCLGSTSTFNAPTGLSGYSWGVTGDGTISGASNGASFSVIAGTSGTYTVSLTVTSASGCTNTCSQTVTINTVPICPSTYTPSNGQTGVPIAASSLSWATVPNITHYLVYFGSNAPSYDNIFNGYDNGASTSKSYAALMPNTTYGYRIVPVNDCGEAVGCSTITFSTCVPSFTCPANQNVNLSGTCTITIPDLVTGLTANPGCGSLTFTQSPTAGTVVSSSHNATVAVTITPNNSAVSTCEVTLTGKDVTAPTITCPSNIAKTTDPGQCSAVTTYANPTFSDNCAGAYLTLTSGQASGTQFPIGMTNVAWKATDLAGNSSVCNFTVTVTDGQAPGITCPANIVKNTDAGLCTAVVTYANPTFSDNCSGATAMLFSGQASGTAFPKGANSVTWQATDGAGLTKRCPFTVTVNDAQAPTIACPGNQVKAADAGICTAVVNYSTPTFTDNCAGAGVAIQSGLVSGSAFPKGITTVVWKATDGAGLTKTCSFKVTVNDTQAPTFTLCPSSQSINTDAGLCTAAVTYTTPTASDNCTPPPTVVKQSGLASGSNFPKGTSVVVWKATDGAGLTKTCSFTVTVTDAQLPTITCPGNIAVPGSGPSCNAVVTYPNPTATDNCAITSNILLNGLASGANFSQGVTTNVWRATDNSGLTQTCAFTVTVSCGASPNPSKGGETVERDVVSPPLWGDREGLLLNLAPNPATTQVQVTVEGLSEKGGELTVFDAQGRMVWQQVNVQSPRSSIDVSTLPSGLYQVRLRTGQGVVTKGLVVSRL